MSLTASTLKRIARDASRAARLAAAATSHPACPAAASRAARSALVAASRAARSAAAAASLAARSGSGFSCPCRCRRDSEDESYEDYLKGIYGDTTNLPRDDPPEPGKDVTEKDLQSDEALWALYELWCKAYNKERDRVEMSRRFDVFKQSVKGVHDWNTAFKRDQLQLGKFADGADEVVDVAHPGESLSTN